MAPGDRTLARHLDGLLGRGRRRLLGYGVATLALVGGVALLAAAWILGGDGMPPGWVRWGLILSLTGFLFLLVLRFLVLPLAALRSRRDLVADLEGRGDHGNLLVAAEESLRREEAWMRRGPAARELVARLRQAALARLRKVTDAQAAPLPDRRPLAAAAVLVAAATVLLGISAGHELWRGTVRLATPWQGPPSAPLGGIYGLPTAPFAVAGDTLDLVALDLAALDPEADGRPAVCEIRLGTGLWQEIPASLQRPATGHAGRLWRARLAGVHDDLEWRFRRDRMVSPTRRLVVRDRPLLAALGARVEPPAYTRVPAQDADDLPGWLEVPRGSRVNLRGRTSHAVAAAFLLDSAGDTLALALDSLTVRGTFAANRSRVFRIHLVDAWGLTNASPLRYELVAVPDRDPVADLSRPDDDGLLPLAGAVTLVGAADDDYGVAGMDLEWRVRSEGREGPSAWRRAPLETSAPAGAGSGAGSVGFSWNRTDLAEDDPPLQRRFALELELGDLHMVAGDVVELALVARDNRVPGPAGTGRSRELRLLVPSAAEVLAQHDESDADRRDELSEMRRRGRELGTDLERLTRELMKNPVPDWGRQQEMEEALRRQARLQEELSRVADELARELQNLAEGQLTSERQMQRSDQMEGLLRQENSDRLADLVQRLEQEGDRPDSGEITRALRQVANEQKDLARRLDAALDLLERMGREQDLEGITALLEQVIRKQQELADLSREMADREAAADSSMAAGEAAADSTGQTGESGAEDQHAAAEPQQDGAEESPAAPPEEGQDAGQQDAQGEQEAEQQATPEATPEELAHRQEALSQELEQLRDRLDEALEEMRERAESGEQSAGEEKQRQALEEALEKLEQQIAEGGMQDAAQQLEEMDPQQAAEMQQQAVRDLGSLYHVMLESQQAMQMAMQMNQAQNLRGLAGDLLAVSARQELVADKVPVRLREVRTLGLTREQHRLQKATVLVRDNLAEIQGDAPVRIQKQLKQLDGLIEEMGYAVHAFEDNRAAAARSHTRRSLANANRIVIGLLTEAQMVSGSSGQGSSQSQSAAEQLQEMIRKQAQLNGATDEMRRMLANRGMSQEMRAGMQRLGEEQARMAEGLRDVAREERERPDGGRLLGDLDALAQDMETVGESLDDGLANEEVLARQERILGRMLDARNSVRRRDFSNRRESRGADELFGPQVGPDPLARGEASEGEALRYQSLEEAPLVYRELVRRYFAALADLRRQAAEDGGELP